MTHRGVLLADGSSDEPLATHLEAMCGRAGRTVEITVPDLARLPEPPGLSVADRLRAVLRIDSAFSVLFIHRDAERQPPSLREKEIERALEAAGCTTPCVRIVPVTMTEAWLLLDEPGLRQVAGNPNGRTPLGLPAAKDVERIPDPKGALKEALLCAANVSGRRRKRFEQRFPEHRRQLLDRLDPAGAVATLPAWRRLEEEIATAMAALAP